MDRRHFISELNRLYYGEGSPLVVPKYRLDAALQAILDVITDRARAGEVTWWEHVGTFTPYVRPAYVLPVKRTVRIDHYPWWEEYVEDVQIPAKTWLFFRPSKPVKEMESFLNNGLEGGRATYTGEPDGAYKLGRQAVWVAVRGVLSEVVKKPGAEAFFTRGYDEAGNARRVASDYFVNSFLFRLGVAIRVAREVHLRGWGYVGGWPGGYIWVFDKSASVWVKKWKGATCWSTMSKSLNLDVPTIPIT